ncbi:MAG: MGH1-like glycoside hydrolase domain-containing protein, partial [Promethearchaeota archaeon]
FKYTKNLTFNHLLANKKKISKIIEEKIEIPTSAGKIKDSIESIITIIGINSLKTPDKGWITSLCRRAGVLFKGWSMYLWDNSFIGMMSTLYYPELAIGNIKAFCSELTHKGFLPNQAHPLGRAETISQLPVTSYCALKISKLLGKNIEGILDNLKKNNDWWLKNRDPNRFHILSYGSELKKRCAAATRQMAKYESGMDNHPMFDKVPMDYNSGCMALYPVCLNSIYALDCISLSNLAELYGNIKLSKILKIRYENMKKIINKILWDGELYRNRYWNGDFQDGIYASYLFPMIAGIPSKEQAQLIVKKIFKKCLTPFGIAPSAIDDPSFYDQITWRGRILPPFQFLVSESLRRYEFDLEASELARRCYRCFHNEWANESHFHESYNGITGDGDDVSITGEPSHPWAALLPYLSIQDLIDFEVWNNTLRFGRLEPINAEINNIPVLNKKYSVLIKDKEQVIKCNDKVIIKSNYPTIIRKFLWNNNIISFTQKSLKDLNLDIFLENGYYLIKINKEVFKERINDGKYQISLKRGQNYLEIKKK